MTPIKEIFNRLTQVQKDALMAAFEEHMAYYVVYAPGLWVGVNTRGLSNLNCDQQSGEFTAGTIRETITDE